MSITLPLPAVALAKAGDLQTSNTWTRENSTNNYLYDAGAEMNTNSGWYETFFRGYDPALGRFQQVDPKAILTTEMTPYQYAGNNPVMFNDPFGDKIMLPDDWMPGPTPGGGGGSANPWAYGPSWSQTASTYGKNGLNATAGFIWTNGVFDSVSDIVSTILNSSAFAFYLGLTKSQVEGLMLEFGYIDKTTGQYVKTGTELEISPPTVSPGMTMQQVANEINKGGIGAFLGFILDKNYGPQFFTKSIKSGPETASSNSPLAPADVAFGLKTAAWGHKYFGGNDEVRHIIGSFMMAENFGPISADWVTTANEFFGLLTIDIPNWMNGNSSSAFEVSDYVNNQAGIMLWSAYSVSQMIK